jgi:hypothetical protein
MASRNRKALIDAIDKLAAAVDGGELMAATDPAGLLLSAATELTNARLMLDALSQWAADAVYAMGRVAPDAPRFEALEDRLDEIRAAMRADLGED